MSRLTLAAVACAFFAAQQTDAADATFVKLVHVATGKVLATAGDSGEGGTRAVLAGDEKGQARQWRLDRDGAHTKLVNRKSGKALDVYENSTDDGASVIIWSDKQGSPNQLWVWDADGTQGRLRSKLSGLVLDVDAEGRAVQRKADPKSKGQLWRLVEVKE